MEPTDQLDAPTRRLPEGRLVTEEIAHRQQTRLARLTRRAHFPFLKTIDDLDFTYQSTLRLQMLGSALAPDFVTEGRPLIFSGKPGRGKTHLAVAIAYRAIQNGFDALFTTAATLIDDLSAAFRAGQAAQRIRMWSTSDLTELPSLPTTLVYQRASTTTERRWHWADSTDP